MSVITIDELSGNPFPSLITLVESGRMGFIPASTEGYHHNDELIKTTVKRLAEIIGLDKGQRTIDVGYGSNLSVAEAMGELGMDSYGLDSQDGWDKGRYKSLLYIPPHFIGSQNGVEKYCGTVEDLLHPESELKDKTFDLFMFWGSWESGGYNFAIGGEMGEARVREEQPELAEAMKYARSLEDATHESLYDAMQENKDKILRDAKSLLNPDGGIMIVSSRYAGHGAGFTTDQLPREKRIMLRLAHAFADLGAQEVQLIGVSKSEVGKQLSREPDFSDIGLILGDDSELFGMKRNVYEARYPDGMLRAIKEMQVPLGRIDAVYGKF
jgi:hypothetical protein